MMRNVFEMIPIVILIFVFMKIEGRYEMEEMISSEDVNSRNLIRINTMALNNSYFEMEDSFDQRDNIYDLAV